MPFLHEDPNWKLVPEKEQWLYQNQAAFKSVEKGIEEAKQGKITKNAIDLNNYTFN